MKKYLAWFAVFILASFVITGQHEYDSEKSAYQARGSGGTVTPKNPKQTNSQTADSNKYAVCWKFAFVILGWPVGIGVCGLMLTFVAIADQAVQTRKAAEAGDKSANAALLSAQAAVNSERPWIVVSIRAIHGPSGGFKILARNKGRTPAFIVDSRMNYIVVQNMDALPPAHYPFETLRRNMLVLPDRNAFILWFDGGTVKRGLKGIVPQFQDEGRVFICGRIRYRDLLSPESSILHETRWISLYEPSDSGPEVRKVEGIGLSADYENYT